MPLKSIYGIKLLIMQLNKASVLAKHFKKKKKTSLFISVMAYLRGACTRSATYSLFWLFLLLPLRIFIPVWYITSASCICRLLVASSSAKNKMLNALKWILILHQLFTKHQHVFCLLRIQTQLMMFHSLQS